MPRDVNAQTPRVVVPEGATRHGLVVGIDAYHDKRLNLRCAVADARAVHELMVDAECGCFPHENVQLLLDDEATTERIFRALARLRRQVAENDVVWIYYAGHAALEEHAYWVAHDTDVDDLFGTGLSSERINSALSQLRTPNLVLLLDCCHAAATALVKNPTRSVVTAKEIFAGFQGHGRITLAASDGKQKSVELPEFGHGAFTYFLEKGLRGEADMNNDGVVTADELWSYLRSKVTEASRRVGNLQTPILSGSMTHDIALTKNVSVTRKNERLMLELEKLVGFREHQLSTEQGRFCAEILIRGALTESERSLLESLGDLAAGQLTPLQFRRFVYTNMQIAAANAREEAATKAREEAATKAREEAATKAREEAATKARDEAARRAREEAAAEAREQAARAREEAAAKAREEAAAKAREEAAAEAREQAARAREEAAAKAREEAAAKAREGAEIKARQEAATKAREEVAAKTRQEAWTKARQEAASKAREETATRAREEAASKAREEAASKAREEAATKAREEVAAKARQEAWTEAREEAAAKAREEAATKAREEAAIKAREESATKAREEVVSKAREEAASKAREEAATKVREDVARAREDARIKAREEAAAQVAPFWQDYLTKRDEINARADANSRAREEAAAKAREETAAKTREEAAALPIDVDNLRHSSIFAKTAADSRPTAESNSTPPTAESSSTPTAGARTIHILLALVLVMFCPLAPVLWLFTHYKVTHERAHPGKIPWKIYRTMSALGCLFLVVWIIVTETTNK